MTWPKCIREKKQLCTLNLAWYVRQFKTQSYVESLTENRLDDVMSSAIFQFHERCFTPPLSEFEHIKMWNGSMTHIKTLSGPQVGNYCDVASQCGWIYWSLILRDVVYNAANVCEPHFVTGKQCAWWKILWRLSGKRYPHRSFAEL